MKPLFKFETPGKRQSIHRAFSGVEEHLLPRFKSTFYKVTFQQVPQVGSGVLLSISLRKPPENILVVPWFRPYGAGKTTVKVLADYPRLNVHKDLKSLEDGEKLRKMQELVKKFHLHFLVILQKPNGNDLYWFGAYEDIPTEYWKLTYRKKKGGMLDRIHFPGYEQYDFQNFDELRKKINKTFRNEN